MEPRPKKRFDRERGGDRERGQDREKGPLSKRKISPKYALPKDTKFEYKNLSLITRFMTESGKILSRRITGITGKQQRELELSVKRARYLGVLNVGGRR